MNGRADVTLFGVDTVADYLRLCDQAVSELGSDQANVLRGFTAILALNHLPDWLRYKLSPDERMTLNLEARVETPLQVSFESRNAELRLIRDLANGFKHLRPVDPTGRIHGFGTGPFGVGPFGVPYLLIDLGERLGGTARWTDCYSLCQRVLTWWHEQLVAIITEPRVATE